MNRQKHSPRALGGILGASFSAVVALGGASTAQTDPYMERTWGGETRQVFTLEVPSSGRHVWNVGDGALIRHAVNPGTGVTWTVQQPPSDVTQNLLDVHFIEGGSGGPPHLGFAVGVNGHVLTSPDYGTTWVHLDSGEVQNQLSPTENATLWRGRFLSEDDGFVAGLWTFKRWNGATSTWTVPTLLNSDGTPTSANLFEFYALEILIDPSDPGRWVGVAAGQRWGTAGGGHGSAGSVFYASSAVNGGNTWKEVFRLQGLTGPAGLSEYQDPWDVAFEPNPSSLNSAVGYLCVGTGHPDGAVFRTNNSGRSWSTTADLADTLTLYGIGVLGPDDAFAVGYGGQVWVRDSTGWICRRGTGSSCVLPGTVNETQTAPLAGAHGAGTDMYATGSWGYLHLSTNGFLTNTVELDPSSSDAGNEHWRFGDLDFTSSLIGYTVSANKTIIETTDGGVQWDLSASSPGSLAGPGTAPLAAIDFRNGGGSGVAVGWGDVSTLAPFTPPTLQQGFAYHQHQTSNPTWTASQLAFTPSRNLLRLDDVAWANGDGATAEFWAVGRAGNNNFYNPANQIPMLLRSTDGGATWTDANAAAGGVVPTSVYFNAVAFRSATEGFAVGWTWSTLPRSPTASTSPARRRRSRPSRSRAARRTSCSTSPATPATSRRAARTRRSSSTRGRASRRSPASRRWAIRRRRTTSASPRRRAAGCARSSACARAWTRSTRRASARCCTTTAAGR